MTDPNKRPSIAFLLTCHNRKLKTIACLDAVYNQIGFNSKFQVDVFLVDDASTDGTADAVAQKFPLVNVIEGNGSLFWNRGMHLAWQKAAAFKDYDFYIWLNDDTIIFPDAVSRLLHCYESAGEKSVICGLTCSRQTGSYTYGGKNKNGMPILPNGTVQQCEFMNGNCVLVSKLAYHKVGNLDPLFIHAIGDYDYGFRAVSKGFSVYITDDYIGNCEINARPPDWCLQEIPFKKRVKSLYSPLGNCHPKYFFIYEKRHFGLSRAVFHFFTIHLRLVVPYLWERGK